MCFQQQQIASPSMESDGEQLPFPSPGVLSCAAREPTPCVSKPWSGSVPQRALEAFSVGCSPEELTGVMLGSCLVSFHRDPGTRQRHRSRFHPGG